RGGELAPHAAVERSLGVGLSGTSARPSPQCKTGVDDRVVDRRRHAGRTLVEAAVSSIISGLLDPRPAGPHAVVAEGHVPTAGHVGAHLQRGPVYELPHRSVDHGDRLPAILARA